MRDRIALGSAPSMEDCAQVGTQGYYPRARKECRAYIAQLRRMFGEEPAGARLTVRSNPHDFGTYLSVAVEFDPAVEAAVDYALRCESAGSREWDELARTELSLNPKSESREDSERQS